MILRFLFRTGKQISDKDLLRNEEKVLDNLPTFVARLWKAKTGEVPSVWSLNVSSLVNPLITCWQSDTKIQHQSVFGSRKWETRNDQCLELIRLVEYVIFCHLEPSVRIYWLLSVTLENLLWNCYEIATMKLETIATSVLVKRHLENIE